MTFLHAENTTPNGTTAICSFNNSIVVLSIILNIKLYKKINNSSHFDMK